MDPNEGGSGLDPAAIPADSKYVCIDRLDEADYWRSHFGTSRDELEQAVEAVGHGYAAVAAYLNQDRSKH